MTATPDRVLVRAPNWLGDAVLALPAMAAVRRHFRDARLTVAGPSSLVGLFRDDTDAAPDDVIDVADERGGLAAIRAGRFDLGVLFPNSFQSAWTLRRAGVRERWGFGTAGRGWLLTRRSARPKPAAPSHHADYFRALVRGLGIECDDRLPRVAPLAIDVDEAAKLVDSRGLATTRLVGVAPGAAYGEAKQWPTDRMGALVARLVRERDTACLLFGASHDRTAVRAIESWLRAHAPETLARSRVVDLAGRTNLRLLTALVARCETVVSNDSGAMHLAAAVGRPVVAIFGPTDERSTRPLGDHDVIIESVFCRPCLLRDCPIDHRCMTRISTDRVFEAVCRRLDRKLASPLAS